MIPLRIRLPYASEAEFIERYGSNVARGGVFIATRALKPEGTEVAFELVLSDGTRLMRGEGVVQKTQVDEGGQRSGMTIRFTRLDARGKALIDKLVALRSGLAPALPEEQSITNAPLPPRGSPAAPRANATPPPAAPEPPTARAEADPPHEEPTQPGGVTPPARLGSDPDAVTESHVAATEPPAPPRRRSLPELPVASPKADKPPEVVLGIDLGTTNSRVAVIQDGAPRLVPLGSDGKGFAIPSVVALDEKGRFVVGARAKAMVLTDPAHTVYGAKRLLGRRARSKRLKEMAGHFPYRIAADELGDAGVELRGKVYSLPELSGMLLSELKSAAQEYLGREVTKAVLCVPAYFNDHQRAAMLDAGRHAGLEILRILNEPSAVALAFGYGRGLARKRVFVYDLGGGTFDASVVALTGDDLEVITTGGDNFLDGLDFDSRLASDLASRLGTEEQSQVSASLQAVQRIRDAAEQAKITLSERESATVHIPFATTRTDGSPVDLSAEVTRSTLESLTQDLVDRTLQVTQAVLDAGSLKPSSLDELVLVGGQSRAPLVRRRVEDVLQRPVRTDVDPHGAVAIGAAILGDALIKQAAGKRGISLAEVLSAPIGIAVKGGGMKKVLERNTRLPAEKTISVPAKAGQAVGIAVFQGDAVQAEENEYLGALHATVEKAGDLTVRFQVSPDGKVEVSALTPLGKRTEATFSTLDASDELKAALLAQAPLPGEELATGGGLLKGLKKLLNRGP